MDDGVVDRPVLIFTEQFLVGVLKIQQCFQVFLWSWVTQQIVVFSG